MQVAIVDHKLKVLAQALKSSKKSKFLSLSSNQKQNTYISTESALTLEDVQRLEGKLVQADSAQKNGCGSLFIFSSKGSEKSKKLSTVNKEEKKREKIEFSLVGQQSEGHGLLWKSAK